MAIARPVRMLLLAAVVMWMVVMYMLISPGSHVGRGRIKKPHTEKLETFERDPNLDRKPSLPR